MNLESIKDEIVKRLKLSKRQVTYIAIAAMALIFLIVLNSFESTQPSSEGSDKSIPSADDSYEKSLTAQLEKVISKIDGVGEVSIMLTMEGTSSYVYVQDVEKADFESKSETVILGNKEALIKSIENPKVKGVLIVCDGGDSPGVRERVINAVSTVLNISSNRVYVTKKN